MQLSQSQQKRIQKYLDQQGLNFQPLRAEIEDHLLSDLEQRMDSGASFDEAWVAITQPLAETHFSSIQYQTMETIKKRLSISNFLINISIGLLLVASLFKLLHFPGTTWLVLSSLLSLGISFLATSLSGIRRNTDKKRVGLMIVVLAALLLFWISWLFAVIQLPGMVPLRTLSIFLLLMLFPFLQQLISQKEDTSREMIVYLHEKATAGINRLILLALALATLLKLFSISMNYPPQVSAVFAIMVLIIAGFHLFASTWHNQYNGDVRQHTWLKIFMIGLFVIYFVPALGSVVPLEVRAMMVYLFYLGMGYLVFLRWNLVQPSLGTLSYILISIFLTGWLFQTLGWMGHIAGALFNLPVLLIMVIFLMLSQKNSLQRLLWCMVVAHFLFEYPFPHSLW